MFNPSKKRPVLVSVDDWQIVCLAPGRRFLSINDTVTVILILASFEQQPATDSINQSTDIVLQNRSNHEVIIMYVSAK